MAPLPNFLRSGARDAAENKAGTPRSSPQSPEMCLQLALLRVSRPIPA